MKLIEAKAENIEMNTVDIHLKLEGMQEALKLAETLTKIQGEVVDIDAKKHHEKRSLNANSYLRVLEGKIAEKKGLTKDEAHNLEITRYGQYQLDGNGNMVWYLLPADTRYEDEPDIHLKPTGHTEYRNGKMYAWFALMKPTHMYDTKEMAILIDGVISDAKELGIETLSDDEIRRIEAVNG